MKKSIKKKRCKLLIRKYSYEFFLITLGTMIMSIGTSLLLLPNQLSAGGFSGLATITYYIFNWKMGIVIILLNIPLFIIAFIRIGKEFIIKSIFGTISISIFIDFFSKYDALTKDRFLACIYGGIIIGIGTSLVLRVYCSTGGSDLVSYIIKTFKPGLSTSNLIIVFDFIVIVLNMICFRQLEIGLYSVISIYLIGKVIDIVFEGVGFSKMIYIISKEYKKISKEITNTVSRGITGIYSKGMYTDEKKMMLMCIVGRGEIVQVRQIAKKIDPNAFIVIANVREVYGKGFKKA